jgi:glycine reductase
MKIFSAYSTGGNFEATGYGYGPGIGDGYRRLILILSRSSGVPVVANALVYAARLAQANVTGIAQEEYGKAKNAGLLSIIASHSADANINTASQTIAKTAEPDKEIVTEEVAGIEIFDLDKAVMLLKSNGIYAESGMGCTGPVVLVNEKKHHDALALLLQGGFIGE